VSTIMIHIETCALYFAFRDELLARAVLLYRF